MSERREPLVFLVGAGPGCPGLLTLRAVECLRLADLVIYDKLVPRRLLEHVRESAETLCVSDLPGDHPNAWPHVHQAMIAAAHAGRRVVRLKGGDPFIFGRGGEEAMALRQAGIPFEIVPGITSGLAAAVFSGIPVTHREHSSAVALVTGHENPLKADTSLDWAALARFPGTLVIYMGISRLPLLTEALLRHGMAPRTPAAVVHRATTGEQESLEAPLSELPAAVQAAGLSAPAIIIIGSVVNFRADLRWFEDRPLFGKRVVVTRPKHQAGDLVRRLEQLGAIPFVLPAVEVRDLDDWSAVDRALADLARYDWLVFTSVNGVHAFLRRLWAVGRDLRALAGVKLAAIGPATADALRSYHLAPDLVPGVFRSEDLAAALKERVAGRRVLLARADRGREVLRQELASVAEVEQVAVYRQVDAVAPDSEVFACLRRGEIDYLTFSSSNIARAFLRNLDEPCALRLRSGEVKIVTISPVTSAAVAEFGFPVAGEATSYTSEGLLEALVGANTAAVEPHAQPGAAAG